MYTELIGKRFRVKCTGMAAELAEWVVINKFTSLVVLDFLVVQTVPEGVGKSGKLVKD